MSVRDVAVVGLGGMGSAVLARCAMRGVDAIGIEQFELGHALGASTGRTRIIRAAYYEDPAYVPLLLRAYELWRDVETRTYLELLRITGLLMAGAPESDVIAGSLSSARAFALPVEELDARDMRARYSELAVRDGEVGVYEPHGGIVFPETAVNAHLGLAKAHGAEIRDGTALAGWDAAANGNVRLRLGDGSQIEARSAVFTLGPWFARELHALGVALTVQRNVQVWFEPATPAWNAGRFPAFLIERPEHPVLYGFPDLGDGVKAAFHGFGETTDPEHLRRDTGDADVVPLAHALEGWMPGAAHTLRSTKACMYSLTPDQHFVIDTHPAHPNVVLCGGFSGHGFKFASVVGEIGAQLALDGASAHDIGFLSLARFAANSSA